MKKQVVSTALIVGMLSPTVHGQPAGPRDEGVNPESAKQVFEVASAVGSAALERFDQYLEGRFQEAGTTTEVKNGVVTILADTTLLMFLNRISDSTRKLEGQSRREAAKVAALSAIRTEATIDEEIRRTNAATEREIGKLQNNPGMVKPVRVMSESDRIARATIQLDIEKVESSRAMTDEAKTARLAELNKQLEDFDKAANKRRITVYELNARGKVESKRILDSGATRVAELQAEREAFVSRQPVDGNERITRAKEILEGRVKGTIELLESDKVQLLKEQRAAAEKAVARLNSARSVMGRLGRVANLGGRVFVVGDAVLAGYIMVGVSRDGEVMPLGSITVSGAVSAYNAVVDTGSNMYVKAVGWVEQQAEKERRDLQQSK